MPGRYVLKMIAYNGINIPLKEGTYKECLARARKRIEYYKRRLGGTVSVLHRGLEWELVPSDNAVMIGDCDGYLRIRRCGDG